MNDAWTVRASALAAIAASLIGCISPATSVSVLVDTDARDRVTSMTVSVWRGTDTTGRPETHTWNQGQASLNLPASFAVTPGNTPHDGTATLQIDVTLAGEMTGQPSVSVSRVVRFRFVPHTLSVLRLYLPATCGAIVGGGLQCTDTSVPCTMSEYCRQQSPPQTCGNSGQCVAIDAPLTEVPPPYNGDESTLAHGNRPAFYECDSHAECVPGTVCVDNGGDGHFFCKPLCQSDTDCTIYGFPTLRCYPEFRQDGTVFQHHVCNDNPSMLHSI